MARRLAALSVLLFLAACLPASAQQSIESALSGQEVTLKIDMPGSQKGVDLRCNQTSSIDWKDYGKRIKQYGIALRKGDTARVTAVVVKNDRIEVQLNGGGFGTFGDNTSSTVAATVVDKSDYEKQLERDISNTDDPDKRRDLQRDLDRERSRRDRQNQANQRDAQIASVARADQLSSDRAGGGSRFNLRWSGSIPPDQRTPEAVLQLLADYMVPAGSPAQVAGSPQPGMQPMSAGGGDVPQIRRGMTMAEVAAALGPNRQVSAATSADGLKTEVEEYTSGDHRVQVTFVDGIVVRYTISSR